MGGFLFAISRAVNRLIIFFDRELKAYLFKWRPRAPVSLHLLVFKLQRYIEERIVLLDKRLRHKVKGVAQTTGHSFHYAKDFIKASSQRPHTMTTSDALDLEELPSIEESDNSALKIVHAVNLFIPPKKNKSLHHRTQLTLKSLERAAFVGKEVILLGCSSEAAQRTGWSTRLIPRNAKNTLGHTKDFLFLKDILDAAADLAEDDDYIVYSNLDCPITQDFYSNLLKDDSDIVEYIRRDCESKDTLEELFAGESWPYATGRDAFAFKKKVYQSLRDYIPDFIIGEPHWDTGLSGLCQKLHKTTENLTDVYHIDHARTWDNNSLSLGGEYNQRLWMELRSYGVSEIDLLSVEKQKGVVIYNHDCSRIKLKKLERFLERHMDYEIVLIDLVKKERDIKEDIFEVRYYPILHKGRSTLKVNQTIPLKNIGLHIMEGFKEIKFISLKELNKNNYTGQTLSEEKQQALDNYLENEAKNINIRKESYINDEGLLQLCWD